MKDRVRTAEARRAWRRRSRRDMRVIARVILRMPFPGARAYLPSLRILVDDVVIEERSTSVVGLVSNSECVEDRNVPAKPLTLIVLVLGLPACGSDSPTSSDPPVRDTASAKIDRYTP